MALGLSMSPGVNTPRGYQQLSEENLNNYGQTTGEMAGAGRGLIGAGQGALSRWGGRANQMYGLASGIAMREPSWYADRAGVTSNQAFDESKGIQDRTLSRMGINPNSGRFVGLQTQWGLARAAAEAGARTRASQDAEQSAFQKQLQLLNEGQQGFGEGLRAMGQGAGLLNAAGNDYGRQSSAYGGLAGEAQKAESMREAQVKNATQAKIDQMLSEIQMSRGYQPTFKNLYPSSTLPFAGGRAASL